MPLTICSRWINGPIPDRTKRKIQFEGEDLRRGGDKKMAGSKDNKGNKYEQQPNHADAVIKANPKHPAQKNPWDDSGRKSGYE